MATFEQEQELREWEASQVDRPARERFEEAASGILGPRELAFRRQIQTKFQRPEGGAPILGGGGGIVRGADLGRRTAAQARLGGAYGQAMGSAVGTALDERRDAMQVFRAQQDQARQALEDARQRTATAAFGLAGQGVGQVGALAQRAARNDQNRRKIAFNLAYSDLVSQGIPIPDAWARAAEITGYDPVTGEMTAPQGAP